MAILVVIFNRYIVKYNLAFIESKINKYMPIKFRKWFNINKGIDFNNKLVLFIFVFRAHLFLILWCLFSDPKLVKERKISSTLFFA